MQTLTVFISSPSDVQQERTIAGRVIERLQGKYWSFVRLDDVFWENKAMRATAHFQDELVNPGKCDIVLGILWTRLGSPLPERFRKLTGQGAATGTEWELEQAFAAYDKSLSETGDPTRAKPDVLVYRRKGAPPPSQVDETARKQCEALDAFINREFFNNDAAHTFKRALNSYATPEEFEEKLQKHLEDLILRRIPTLSPGFDPPPISGPPFKDLKHFDYEDSDRFFGRNRAIREVQQLLIERARAGLPFVLIYGGSGYGKSSLMHAGVAPVLTRPGGAAPGMDQWRRVRLQPGKGSGPLCERLARALMTGPSDTEREKAKAHEHWALSGLPEIAETAIAADGSGEKWDVASLGRLLADEKDVLDAASAVAWTLDCLRHSLLLQVDQLEEVFTAESVTLGERESFFRAIATLARTGRVWAVATMRNEYFPEVAKSPALAAMLGKNGGYTLLPPTAHELREIIRFPALAARLDYERSTAPREIAGALSTAEYLDEQILADAGNSADALPLIEFTLHKLYAALLDADDKRRGDVLRWDTYAMLGGLKGAIARTAEDVFARLEDGSKNACETLFANLVRVGSGAADVVTRRRPQLDGLRAAAPGAKVFLDAFIASNLLITDEESGQAVVTLAHEALLTHWPRLAEWIARHRAILRSRQRLEENTRMWVESHHNKKLLLTEGRLAEAQEVERSPLFQLTMEERALVTQSRNRAKLRWRVLQGAVVLFAGIAAIAFWQRYVAQEAKREVEGKNTVIEEKSRELTMNLHEASMADYNVAVQRIEKDNKWHEGVLYLARALKWWPENQVAATRLYNTLSFYAPARQTWPSRIFHHQASINNAEFSPNGSRIVTASDDKTAQIWDTGTGSSLGEALRHSAPVNSARFSQDGSRIVTASDDKTARIWDATTGRPMSKPLKHESEVGRALFSPDGSRVLTVSGNVAQVWDAATGSPLSRPMPHERDITDAYFSPFGDRVVTSSLDRTARIWAADTGTAIGKPMSTGLLVWSADFSPDGKRVVLATGSEANRKGEANVYDAANGHSMSGALMHNDNVTGVEFSPDSERVVTASWDGTARIWNSDSGAPIGEPMRHKEAVNSARFSPDGTRIVTASDDGLAQVWDAATGKQTGLPMVHARRVKLAKFSSDGMRVVTECSGWNLDEWTVQVWDATTGKPLSESLPYPRGSSNRQFAPDDGTLLLTASQDRAQFAPDSTLLLTTSQDGAVRLWDVPTGGMPSLPLRHFDSVKMAQFSPDGQTIFTTSGEERSVSDIGLIWSLSSSKILREIDPNYTSWGRLSLSRFSGDNARMLVVRTFMPPFVAGKDLPPGGSVEVVGLGARGKGKSFVIRHEPFVTDDNEPLKLKSKDNRIFDAQFSSDGERLVTACVDHTARIWDAVSGNELGQPLHHEAEVTSASFSPDDATIATASGKEVRLWDAEKAVPLCAPMSHESTVLSAWFSPAGNRIVTLCDNKTTVIWDTQTGAMIGAHMQHENEISSAQFTADGRHLLTVSGDHTVALWDLSKGQKVSWESSHSRLAVNHDARLSPDGAYILTVGSGTPQDERKVTIWNSATGRPACEALLHESRVWDAQFSPGGERVVTACEDHTARVWDIVHITRTHSAAPPWIYNLACAVAGLEFDSNGQLQSLPQERRNEVIMKPASGDDPWSHLARWLAIPSNKRTVTPDVRVTSREIAIQEIHLETKDGIESALRYDPAVPLAHVLLAKFEENPQRADFLRGYGMKLLPEDATLWARAAASLVEQEDFKRALQAADKALSLDPNNADAQKAHAAARQALPPAAPKLYPR